MEKATSFSCKQLAELVTDYLEGALGGSERARFEAHTAACPHCERYLRQMQITIDTAGRLTEDDLQPETRDQLLVVFRNWNSADGRGATVREPATRQRLFARLVGKLRG